MTEQLTKADFIVPLECAPSSSSRLVHMKKFLPLCCCHEIADTYGRGEYHHEFAYSVAENIDHTFYHTPCSPIVHSAVCRRTTVRRYKTEAMLSLMAIDPTTARDTYDAIYAEVVELFARFLESWLNSTSRSRKYGYSGKAFRNGATWGFELEYRKIIKRKRFITETLSLIPHE